MRKSTANIFTGVMNGDADPRAVQPGDYAYALNILNGSQAKPGAVINAQGNTLQEYTMPSGTNVCLGAIEDKVAGSLVYFFWNNNENHRILRWFQQDNHIEEIAGGSKLDFDRYSRVQGHIIDGRLMYWTEAKNDMETITGNEPRHIDLQKASNYQKQFVYDLYAGFDGQGQFANADEFLFEVRLISNNALVDSQTVTIPDGTYLNDVEAGLAFIQETIEAGDLDDYVTIEECDCKLTFTMVNNTHKLVIVPNAATIDPVLVLRNAYAHTLGDMETFHYALKKEPPSCAPEPTFTAVDSIGYNNVRDGGFQFRSRFIYADGGASHWSAVSNMPLNNAQFGEPQPSLNAIKIDYTDSRLNDPDWLAILDYVEIAFRFDQEDVFRLIERIPICEVGIGEQYIIFANDNLYSPVASDDPSIASGDIQVLTNYHRVPYRAAAIATIAGADGNLRLTLSDVQEGQVCPTCVNGSVEAVQFNDADLVDISGTVEIVNDGDASVTDIRFPFYGSGNDLGGGVGLDGFVVYLAGTPFYAVSDNPADGTGTGRFTIQGVPRGQYVLRVASYACRYGNGLGGKYNLLNGLEWQKTSSPLIDCAGSVAETGNGFERIISLYGFTDAEYDLDVETGFGPIQIQNAHNCLKDGDRTRFISFFDAYFVDTEGETASYEERKVADGVEGLAVSWRQGASDLSTIAKTGRTDHNGYAWLISDMAASLEKLRPVVASWGGDATSGAQPYKVFGALNNGWNGVTSETIGSDPALFVDLNDGETGYDINSIGFWGFTNAMKTAIVFNHDPDWTTAARGQVRGTCLDSNGTGLAGVLIWMAMNGRTTTTNQFGEFALTVYEYDGFDSRIALMELRPVYLPDSLGTYPPSPTGDSTAFDIPDESPFTTADFIFGFAGGIGFNRRFLKSGGRYKIGIVYEDEAGRSPCGVTPFDTVLIPFHTEDGEYVPRQLQWTINSRPPDWAVRFKIVRTKDSFYQTYNHLPVSGVQYARIPENATSVAFTTYGAGDATHVMLNIRTQIPQDPNAVPTLLMFRDNIQDGYKSKFGDRCRYLLDETQLPVFDSQLLEVATQGEYIDGENYWVIIPYTDIQREILPGWMFEFFTPKGFEEEIYYETGSCYDVLLVPHRHSGDIQDQEIGLTPQPAIGYVDSGDTYWRLEQFEIGDDNGVIVTTENETINRYVQKQYEDIGRAFAVDRGGNEQVYTNRIRFSGLYVPSSRINDLSAFGALDYQSLNRAFGPIKWTGMVHTVLLVICQNKVQPVYVGKARVVDLSNASLVGRADQVLNIADETVADAGTVNPESVAVHDGKAFWWDLQRGSVWRYAADGVNPATRGKVNYFRDKHDERILLDRGVDICPGGIDRRNNLYFLTFGLEYYLGPEDERTPVARDTLSYDIEKGGWSSHWDCHAEFHAAVNDDFLQGNAGRLYLCYDNSTYNNFFASQFQSQIVLAVNADPGTMKDWLSLRIQADKKWYSSDIEILPTASWPSGMFSRLRAAKMVLREGQWWAEFMRDMTDPRAEFADIGDAATRETTSLLRGRFLKGDTMLLTIDTNDGSFSNILMRVDVDYADSQNTK